MAGVEVSKPSNLSNSSPAPVEAVVGAVVLPVHNLIPEQCVFLRGEYQPAHLNPFMFSAAIALIFDLLSVSSFFPRQCHRRKFLAVVVEVSKACWAFCNLNSLDAGNRASFDWHD